MTFTGEQYQKAEAGVAAEFAGYSRVTDAYKDIILAALRLAASHSEGTEPQPVARAVAWMTDAMPHEPSMTFERNTAVRWKSEGRSVDPLYARPPSASKVGEDLLIGLKNETDRPDLEDATRNILRRALKALAATPADAERERIELQTEQGFGVVWLVWGLTADRRLDLLAVASTEARRDRYMVSRRHVRVFHERAFVDHAYGKGMLDLINRAALASDPSPVRTEG